MASQWSVANKRCCKQIGQVALNMEVRQCYVCAAAVSIK